MSLNDLLDGGCMVQGPTCVVSIDFDGRSKVEYDGEGEDMPHDADWGDGELSHVYYDAINGCLTFEVEV